MTDKNETQAADPVDASLHAVLDALREEDPPPGLESRVLQRLATSPARASEPLRWPRWMYLAVPTTFVACVLGTFLLQRYALLPSQSTHQSAPASQALADAANESSNPPRIATGTPALKGSRLTDSARHAPAAHATAVHALVPSSNSESRSVHAETSVEQEKSFPAPPMPLTEQERLLLRIAHRNDPVQIAMLDPVERSRALSRERAATERFFTPPPLPPDLQREVDAAVRSQYVNTPPPEPTPSSTHDQQP